MTLPESSWVRYINRLSAINKTAARKFEAYLNTHDVLSKSGRKAALDYAAALVMKYGEGAAAVSCEMYDAVAAASGAILPAAEPAAVASYGEVAKTINGIMKTSQNVSYIASGVERLVKQAGADTTLMNARRDGAEFAWVPHGDTCSFCLMIASNGWREASKKTIKGDHAEHIHANCDCTFAIRFDGKSKVEGYDPDKYREIYDNAEGDTWQEKLNSMRRDEYAANADKIRAQKREAYQRRTENNVLKLAAQEGNDVTIPKFMEGNFDDCHPLTLDDESQRILNRIHDEVAKSGNEYGEIVTSSGRIIPCRESNHSSVSMPTDDIDEIGLKLYHGHTNDTIPSETDLFRLVWDSKVDEIGVVTRNKDVYRVTIGDGYIPSESEFLNIAGEARKHAFSFVAENYDLSNLTEAEIDYLIFREKNIEIIRQLGWRIEGGKL